MKFLISLSKKTIHLSDIPQKYKKYKILNRNKGNNSIVLEKDKDTVLILTRDAMKKEWLEIGIEIGEEIETLYTHNYRLKDSKDTPLYVIEMPKLYPLDSSNKRKVSKDVKEVKSLISKHQSKHGFNIRDRENYINSYVLSDLEKKQSDNIFIDYLQWSTNYSDFYNDIDIRNIMQTGKGDIVVLDPVASKWAIDMLRR